MSEEKKPEWLTTGTPIDPARKAWWVSIFGCDEIPLRSPLTDWVTVPEFEEAQACYWLDLTKIDDEQRARLVDALAARFDLDAKMVDELLEKDGVPVRAEDVVMVSSDFSVLMSICADWDEYDMDDAEWLAAWADYPGELLEDHEVAKEMPECAECAWHDHVGCTWAYGNQDQPLEGAKCVPFVQEDN